MLNKNVCLWQQATRDHEITLQVTRIIRGNSPGSLHQDHSIIACLHHIYMGVILHAHPVCRESHNERNQGRGNRPPHSPAGGGPSHV